MFDTALGQCGRIEQAVEFLVRQVRHFARDFFDRAPLLLGFLGYLCPFFITNNRI